MCETESEKAGMKACVEHVEVDTPPRAEQTAESAAAVAAQPSATKSSNRKKSERRPFFSTRMIVNLAMLTAVGYALSWLEFPIFPAAPFLKLDFSTFATLLGGYMYGPLGAIVIEGIRQLLIFGTKSSTGGVGEIANFMVTVAYILVPTVLYRFRKGKGFVTLGLLCGCLCQLGASLLCNRYINFPLFMGKGAAGAFASLWGYVLAFNAIKSVSISVLVFVLYKKLSFVMKHAFARAQREQPLVAKKATSDASQDRGNSQENEIPRGEEDSQRSNESQSAEEEQA